MRIGVRVGGDEEKKEIVGLAEVVALVQLVS
jgi:hypothetical protein